MRVAFPRPWLIFTGEKHNKIKILDYDELKSNRKSQNVLQDLGGERMVYRRKKTGFEFAQKIKYLDFQRVTSRG